MFYKLANTGLPGNLGQSGIFKNPLKAQTIPALINEILNLLVAVGLPIIAVMIVYVGFLFVKARGNESELKTAKEAFVWTVIGAAIVLGAQVISTAIERTIVNL